MRKVVLYAHYSESPAIPAYVRFALERLQETGMEVWMLANQRKLSGESARWLDASGIRWAFFQNEGFDFGLWIKWLRADGGQDIERLLLINDSVVWYQDMLRTYIDWCEQRPEPYCGMFDNDEGEYHLQSWFLYLKPPAIQIAIRHFLHFGLQAEMRETIFTHEIGLAINLNRQGHAMASRFRRDENPRPLLYMFGDLIPNGAGFIKRKMLEHNWPEKVQDFIRALGYEDTLTTDYRQQIIDSGWLDPRLQPQDLHT